MNVFELLTGLVLLHAVMATVAVIAGTLSGKERIKHMAVGLLLAVTLMQTGVLVHEFWQYSFDALPRAVFMHVLAWIFAVTSLYAWRYSRLGSLVLLLAPFTLVTVLAATLFDGQSVLPQTTGRFFTIHVLCMFVSLACMALAGGAAIFFLVQERSLKSKQPIQGFQRSLPSLTMFDKVNAIATMIGFPGYSLGILFGMVASRLTWGMLLTGDPKELVSLFVWFLYAVLFHQRLAKGWRGRKPALLAVAIFTVAAFSLFVVNALMNTHHSFFLR